MINYLEPTPILDYHNPKIQRLIAARSWNALEEISRVKQIYNFVKDEILFGYNSEDDLPASKVLQDGYGQCNTKASLLMALLRGVGIPNRIHGFTIDKRLQKGAITGFWYWLSPPNILHSWVEVFVQGKWYFLEGVILDRQYLLGLQHKFPSCKTQFCGYGANTDNLENPPVEWDLNNTYIQDKGIKQDFGLFDNPDVFYQQYQQQFSLLKKWMFEKYIRHQMNRNVEEIRKLG